ncbi:MAG: hypothetical protein Phog2KO_04470 [Phototrophicaceae bacterium]
MSKSQKILIFIVSYNAENFIKSVLDRIPDIIWENDKFEAEVLIIDDTSPDNTYHHAVDYQVKNLNRNIKVFRNPENQGYGGNQKLGYHYAIENNFDVVVLLHGDGQYAPEYLPAMVQPILDDEADVVFGSRMLNKSDALKGGMPMYKWLGNQVLTQLQNRVLKSNLAEFHTGYRAYRVASLKKIPFQFNSNYYDFDTDIIIQCIDTGQRITEIPIPTYYGDEISHVNGMKYGFLILKTTFLSRMISFGILYDPKFDYVSDGSQYTTKQNFSSSHQFGLDRIQEKSSVIDIGCGPGFMAEALSEKDVNLTSFDIVIHPKTEQYSSRTVEVNIEEYDFPEEFDNIDTILLLDIIEHLRKPDVLMQNLRTSYVKHSPEIVITTANIGFFVVRFGLFLGQFNYGKRGILDADHATLFTFQSLIRLLKISGYEITEVKGIPAPYPLALGDNFFSQFLLKLNTFLIFFARGLFSYQIAIVAKPLPTLNLLLELAEDAKIEQETTS